MIRSQRGCIDVVCSWERKTKRWERQRPGVTGFWRTGFRSRHRVWQWQSTGDLHPKVKGSSFFFSFLFFFFFAFGFVLFRFSAVVAERLNLHPRRPIGRPRANGNYGRRFHPVVLSLLLRSSFFSLKNFTSMAVGRNLRSGFFLCLPSFLPNSSAENSVTSSRKSLIQPEAKVVFFVVGCRFLRFRVGAHTKKKRPAKVS